MDEIMIVLLFFFLVIGFVVGSYGSRDIGEAYSFLSGIFGAFAGFCAWVLVLILVVVVIRDDCLCKDTCCNHKVCCENGHENGCLEEESDCYSECQKKKYHSDCQEKELEEDLTDYKIEESTESYKYYLEGEEVNGNKMDLDRYYKKVNEEEKEIYLTPKN